MPSIGDIANEAKALLDQINTNTLGTRNNTSNIIDQLTQLNTKVGQLNNTVESGFTNLAQGLSLLIQLQIQNNDLLAGNNRQNETIICWLYKIAHVLCNIKQNTDTELKLQKEISATLSHIDDILELVHAREAMDIKNHYDLESRMDKCCPIEEPKPQPCFEDCESHRLPGYKPINSDWKPIRYEQPKDNK
jgi:hypothetical protein